MNKRIAKKVLRKIYSWPIYGDPDYSEFTQKRADITIERERWKKDYKEAQLHGYRRGTRGYRWGRWDPHFSKNPNEIPF